MKLFVSLFLLSLLLGCQGKPAGQEEKDLSVIEVSNNLGNLVDQLLLSEAVSDIDIIFLEVDGKYVFNRMDHVLVAGTEVFVSPLLGEVLRYSRDGKFINAIGKVGQGPFDLYSSCGIALDPPMQKLQVLTQLQNHKVIDFSLDGAPLDKKDIPSSWFGFNVYNYVHHQDSWFFLRMLQLTDTKQDFFMISKYSPGREEPQQFYNPANTGHEEDYHKHLAGTHDRFVELFPQLVFYGNNSCILFEHNDTVYHFNSTLDSLQVRYIMECGNRPGFNLAHPLAKTDMSFFQYIYVSKILESKGHIYLTVFQNEDSYLLQFNKNTGSIKCTKGKSPIERSRMFENAYVRNGASPGFKNDLCGGLDFYPDYVNERQWIARYEVSDLKEKIDIGELKKQEVLSPAKRDKLVSILENLADDDNPILIVAELK